MSPDETTAQAVTEVMDDLITLTTTEADPIFQVTAVQESHEAENPAGENSLEDEARTSEVSIFECNEMEWDTCVLNEGIVVRNE